MRWNIKLKNEVRYIPTLDSNIFPPSKKIRILISAHLYWHNTNQLKNIGRLYRYLISTNEDISRRGNAF